MDHAQRTFVSSTFWTERIGFAAALAAIGKMVRRGVQKDLIRYGEMINAGWERLAAASGMDIAISGIAPLTHLSFRTEDPLAVQTFYAQEMLEKGYLVGASVYTTFAYSEEIIGGFLAAAEPVFRTIAGVLASGEDIRGRLKGEVVHAGFARLT